MGGADLIGGAEELVKSNGGITIGGGGVAGVVLMMGG
jgi:hypothetical protein